MKVPLCGPDGALKANNPFATISYAPAAQFFCFIGVMSFLICIAYCIGYIVFSPLFANESKGATIVSIHFELELITAISIT